MEDERHLDTVYIEGIKERLEDLIEDNVFHSYGMLIAEGKVVFDTDLIRNPAKLYMSARRHRKAGELSMEW